MSILSMVLMTYMLRWFHRQYFIVLFTFFAFRSGNKIFFFSLENNTNTFQMGLWHGCDGDKVSFWKKKKTGGNQIHGGRHTPSLKSYHPEEIAAPHCRRLLTWFSWREKWKENPVKRTACDWLEAHLLDSLRTPGKMQIVYPLFGVAGCRSTKNEKKLKRAWTPRSTPTKVSGAIP